MKRFNTISGEQEEFSKVDEFLKEILKVCKEYNYNIEHEDGGGAFEITKGYDKHIGDWLLNAHYIP